MTSRLLRLLALVALLWMPFGMSTAPAMPVAHDLAASDHCSDHSNQKDEAPANPSLHCTACAALPAFGVRGPVTPVIPAETVGAYVEETIRGILPEIATPPPKAA